MKSQRFRMESARDRAELSRSSLLLVLADSLLARRFRNNQRRYNRLIRAGVHAEILCHGPSLGIKPTICRQPNYIFICYVISRWPWSDRSMQLLCNWHYVTNLGRPATTISSVNRERASSEKCPPQTIHPFSISRLRQPVHSMPEMGTANR